MRSGQNHDVHPAVDDLLIRIQSDEAVVRINFDTVAAFAFERGEALLQLVLKHVRHRGESHVFVGMERLVGSAGAASAAANEPNTQRVAIGGNRLVGKAQVCS